ncbi:MAG: pentapeptide repeat-containing protein [Candidatus Binatia bacterium]
MANEEHLRILREGIASFNDWRKRNPKIRPDLGDADLHYMDLRGADLSHARLAEANLMGANFSGADLTGARLERANLLGTDLSKANLTHAALDDAKASFEVLTESERACFFEIAGPKHLQVNFTAATLEHANLRMANLPKAIFIRANLSVADLSGARLDEANFLEANLFRADFSKATSAEANFEAADLRLVKGVKLDSAFIRNAKLSPYASDPWSVLRRNYTGPSL